MNSLTQKVPEMIYCAALQFKPLKIIEKIIFENHGITVNDQNYNEHQVMILII